MKLLKKKPALAATAPPHSMCVAGIDFGSQSAKVVLATKGATSRVVAASRLVYPQAVAADPVQQSTFVAGWVERWTARPVRRAFCALPLSLTDYEASDLEPSQVSAEQAATEKLNQMLGGGASQVTSDYWQTSAPDRPARLHVLWSSTTLTTGVTRELAKHRIACSTLTASPATLGTVSAAAGEGRRLVVDLGCGNATIAFAELGTVSYARPRVAIKASEALTSLSSQMGVSAWAAETMISQWGCVPHSGPIADCVQKSFDSWLRSLRFELQRTLSYLQSGVGQGGPTEILLCGGGAELRGIDRWLSQQLGLPVRVCPPPANATWQAAEPYSPVFATAAALATTGGRS